MARQEIDLGTRPTGVGGDTPRSAMVKINAMTQELYLGLDATNKGGWGNADAIRLPDGTNMNNLPYINGIYTLTGASNVNTPEGAQNGHIIVQCADIFVRQTFRQMASNVTWERAGQKDQAFSVWARVAQVGGGLGNGLASQNVFSGNVDTLVATAPMGLSTYSLSETATGVLPPGFVNNAPFNGSTLMCLKWNSDWCRQWLSGGTGGNGGSVGGTYTRLITGGSQGSWLLEYNIQNVLNPVDNANGRNGVMDNRVIGTWRVTRFANGLMTASSASSDVSMPAYGIVNSGFTCPVAFPDWGKVSIQVDCIPTANSDHYGVTTRYMESSTSGYFTIRNGANAQSFTAVRITLQGYWK